MSKYTTELRFVCETLAGLEESEGQTSVANIIETARPKLFNFDYPIFDTAYKPVIETKIIKHFYTREISAETIGLWKLWLETKMNEIMPYYNQLYKSELLEFNPLYDVDITKDHSGTGTEGATEKHAESAETQTSEGNTRSASGTSNDTTDVDVNDWNYHSETPQGGITGLADHEYLTDATNTTSVSNTQNENTFENEENGTRDVDTDYERDLNINRNINTTNAYLEHVKGKNGGVSYSKLLDEYRKTFLNIDMLVIHELDDLFFNLW